MESNWGSLYKEGHEWLQSPLLFLKMVRCTDNGQHQFYSPE